MKISKPNAWQPIYGKFSTKPDEVIYHGGVGGDEQSTKSFTHVGLVMSDLFFAGGTLSARISFSMGEGTVVPSAQFVLFRNAVDDSTIRVGMDGGELDPPELRRMGNFVVALYDGSKTTDRLTRPAKSPWVDYSETDHVDLKVSNVGSSVDVYVNGVLVLQHPLTGTLPRSQCGLFFRAADDVVVQDFRLDEEPKKAFIVMQFSEPYDQIYKDVLRPVAESVGLYPERADEVAGPGVIIADIVRQIRQAEVIIADVTPQNPNVFYELGYAHAIGKPTILLAEKGYKLPFDVSGMRVLFYENSISGKHQLEDGLRRHLFAALNRTV